MFLLLGSFSPQFFPCSFPVCIYQGIRIDIDKFIFPADNQKNKFPFISLYTKRNTMKISLKVLQFAINLACLVAYFFDRGDVVHYLFIGLAADYMFLQYEFHLYKKKNPDCTTKTIESRLYHCARARFQKR